MECGKGGLPVRLLLGTDALEGFERYLAPAVVIALQAREPPGEPLRGKGVAGGQHFRLARLSATQGHVPAIGAKHDPSRFSFYAHRHSPSCVTDGSRCVSCEPRQ